MFNPVARLRHSLGRALRQRVAGDEPAERAKLIWGAEGKRWHRPGDAIWTINGDATMYVGGIRALLLQTLHPGAMAGVAGHSGYRSDPWGRLQRTSEFIAMTTYGPASSAEALITKVRAVHDRVRGKTDDGTPYRASDPHLLEWIHLAETESFLVAYCRYGNRRLSQERRDEYVAQAALVGEMLGAVDLPRSEAELAVAISKFRPELRASPAALDTVDFILKTPPVAGVAKLGYWMLAAGAIATLPGWAREPLGLPRTRWFDRLVGRPLGRFATRAVRWGLGAEEAHLREGPMTAARHT